MNQKVITAILGLAIIGGLAWFFNQNYLQPSGKSAKTQNLFSPKTDSGEQTSANLIYAVFGSSKEIWAADVSGQKRKLFTDADETEKIITLSNLAPTSSEVLAVASSDSNAILGKLVAINVRTAKKEVLQSSFSTTLPISVSTDGKDICFVRFSNVEENYGYTLYSQKRTGFNIRQLVRDGQEIKLPTWNDSGSKIAFSKVSGTKSELMTVDTGSSDTTSVLGFEGQIINWLSWKDSQSIIASISKIGTSSSSEIILISIKDKNYQKIDAAEGGAANFVYFTSGSWLGYLINQNKENQNSIGQIYLKNFSNKKSIPLEKGNKILGWLP